MTISDALKKPAKGVSDWHIPLNENFEKLKAAAATVKSVADGIEFQNPANGTPFLRYNTNTDTLETSKNLEVSGVKFNNKADLTQSGGVLTSSQVPDLGLDTKADLTQSGGVLTSSQVPDLGLDTKADLTQSGGVLTSSQLPDLAITNIDVVADQTARLALNAEQGDVAIQTDVNETFILSTNDPTVDSNWKKIQLDILGAIDGQQITPTQIGTNSNPTTVQSDTLTVNNTLTVPEVTSDPTNGNLWIRSDL